MSKVLRKIIAIDEDKCDGCGLCIPSCAEGALQIINGKARLIKDIYCDGLGNCLGECPQGAIEIIEREAEPFDEMAVEEHLAALTLQGAENSACEGCCGSGFIADFDEESAKDKRALNAEGESWLPEAELSHWPIQLHLVSPEARFLKGHDLLIAADCVPFAYADFHRQFLAGRSLLIGCPKLDDAERYEQKLIEIFKKSRPKSVTAVYMEVGCCFGLSRLIRSALDKSGAAIPLQELVITIDGNIKQ